MKIVSKAGTEMLEINVDGPSKKLNPFFINIEKIRYFREYEYTEGKLGWCVVLGEKKVFPSRELKFDDVKIGDTIKIGNIEFQCMISASLDGKKKYKTLVNNRQLLYMRKFINDSKQNENSNENDIVLCENLDTFAIIWDNERIMPIVSK